MRLTIEKSWALALCLISGTVFAEAPTLSDGQKFLIDMAGLTARFKMCAAEMTINHHQEGIKDAQAMESAIKDCDSYLKELAHLLSTSNDIPQAAASQIINNAVVESRSSSAEMLRATKAADSYKK